MGLGRSRWPGPGSSHVSRPTLRCDLQPLGAGGQSLSRHLAVSERRSWRHLPGTLLARAHTAVHSVSRGSGWAGRRGWPMATGRTLRAAVRATGTGRSGRQPGASPDTREAERPGKGRALRRRHGRGCGLTKARAGRGLPHLDVAPQMAMPTAGPPAATGQAPGHRTQNALGPRSPGSHLQRPPLRPGPAPPPAPPAPPAPALPTLDYVGHRWAPTGPDPRVPRVTGPVGDSQHVPPKRLMLLPSPRTTANDRCPGSGEITSSESSSPIYGSNNLPIDRQGCRLIINPFPPPEAIDAPINDRGRKCPRFMGHRPSRAGPPGRGQ